MDTVRNLVTCITWVLLISISLQQEEEQISRRVDLAFLIDESGSIRDANPRGTTPGSPEDNWMKILNFVTSIITGNPTYTQEGLHIHPSEARVGMVTFANNARLRWDLNQHQNKSNLIAAIEALGTSYRGGNTNTTGGFRLVKEGVFTPSGGDRPGVNDVIVLVTDGEPSREVDTLEDYVAQLREVHNFRIIGVGVTAAANTEKITSLVSQPAEQYYFHVDTFNTFSDIQDALYNRILNSSNTFVRDQDSTKVHTISPLYGPIAGGTKLTVQGEYLYPMEQPTLVYLYQGEEYQLCGTATRATDSIICETSPLPEEHSATIGIPKQIVIKWFNRESTILSTDYSFTYKNNPRIQRIYPLQTIVSGGVELTVQGEDMDSSPAPTIYYDVAVPNMDYNYTDSQTCTVVDQTSIHCLTTEILLPASKELSTDDDCTRDEDVLCQQDLDVYIGIEFDNFKEYRDLRNREDDLKEFNKILVFPDPVVYVGEKEDTLRSWWPHSLHKITAKGEKLNLDAALLHFTIGDKTCKQLEIFDSELICLPRDEKPNGKEDDNKYAVQVRVGVLHFDVTRVGFETSIWDCETCKIGLSCGIAVAGLLILAIVFIIAKRVIRSRHGSPD